MAGRLKSLLAGHGKTHRVRKPTPRIKSGTGRPLRCWPFANAPSIKNIVNHIPGLAQKMRHPRLFLRFLLLFLRFGPFRINRARWFHFWFFGLRRRHDLQIMQRRATGRTGQLVPLFPLQHQRRAGAAITTGRNLCLHVQPFFRALRATYRATAAAFETLSDPNPPDASILTS